MKKRRPRYAVVAKQAIRREAGANAELVGVERDPRTWVNEGDEIAMMSKTKGDELNGKLTEKEKKQEGAVTWKSFSFYIQNLFGYNSAR